MNTPSRLNRLRYPSLATGRVAAVRRRAIPGQRHLARILGLVREVVDEQLEYRELFAQMVRRDLALRYKQTVMGVGWALFMPLLNTAVFSVIFTRVAPLETPIPYPLFAYCGLVVWNCFASAQRFAVVSLTSNPSLVTKVYFPREIFPFPAVAVSFVDFVVACSVLVALMVYYHVTPPVAILLLPLIVAVHALFTAAVALVVSMANLFYRDVKYLFELVMSIWMFASSALYPISMVGGRTGAVLRLNPMTHIIDAYRYALLGAAGFDPKGFAWSAAFSLALLAAAWLLFHRSEMEFAENI
jgi:homopolymeric O-antigen transport system permease protein